MKPQSSSPPPTHKERSEQHFHSLWHISDITVAAPPAAAPQSQRIPKKPKQQSDHVCAFWWASSARVVDTIEQIYTYGVTGGKGSGQPVSSSIIVGGQQPPIHPADARPPGAWQEPIPHRRQFRRQRQRWRVETLEQTAVGEGPVSDSAVGGIRALVSLTSKPPVPRGRISPKPNAANRPLLF